MNDLMAELKTAFDVLNEKLFDGKLTPVEFSVHPKKKVSLRYMHEQKEIILGSDFVNLRDGPDYEILSALLHEMVHVVNHQNNVVDCTINQYHNKRFLEVALNVGLVVIKHKTQGWAITTLMYPRNVVERECIKKPLKGAVHRRIDAFDSVKLDKNVCKKARTTIRQMLKEEKLTTKNYFLKYVCNCPPPHNSIRSGRRPDGPNALNIQCMNCRSSFSCVAEPDLGD